jgi:hypothetical protein
MPQREPDYRKWAESEWRDWFVEKLGQRRNVFKIDPDELVASYNRENTWALAYADRELLELIQNADDAGEGSPKPTEVSVLLTIDSLVVANSGVPFGPEGLKSIMLSDNSPKLLRGGQFTGHRGVGFRAVLGSARTIVILSGRFSVGFSREGATSWLKRLADEDTEIRKKIALFEAGGFPIPAPTLSVPFYLDSPWQVPRMSRETRLALDDLRGRYDTVVCLTFDRPEVAYKRILDQISRISPQVLISLRHVGRVVVTTPQATVSWVIDRENGSVKFQLGNAVPHVWQPRFARQVCLQ